MNIYNQKILNNLSNNLYWKYDNKTNKVKIGVITDIIDNKVLVIESNIGIKIKKPKTENLKWVNLLSKKIRNNKIVIKESKK